MASLFRNDPEWIITSAEKIAEANPDAVELMHWLADRHGIDLPLPPPASEEPKAESSRAMLGKLLDYDRTEVLSKLGPMFDAAPDLGEPLLLEMSARSLDLRPVVVELRDRVPSETLKSWIQTAVTDELERLVYLAMI